MWWGILFGILFGLVKLSLGDLCGNNAHIEGRWALETKSEPSFECCAGHNVARDYDPPNKCGEPEFTVQGQVLSAGSGSYSRSMGHGCMCRVHAIKNGASTNLILPAENYNWIPNNCQLLEWNATQFCELLGNRTLLMVGDSTMQQTALTLMSMLVHAGNNSHESIPKCLPQINFELSDYLVYNADESRGINLIAAFKKYWPRILILQAGPHYTVLAAQKDADPKKESYMHYFFPKLREDFNYLLHMLPEHLHPNILFKTENPGHTSCQDHHEPLKTIGEVAISGANDKYHWSYGAIIDDQVKEFAAEMNMGVIDMKPLLFRADAHAWPISDCLHYCLPGPLNIFPRLLMNKLATNEIV